MTLDVEFTESKQSFDTEMEDVSNQSFDPEMADTVFVRGQNGATFTPSVSQDGVISWTNDKGLENPSPVNIKGAEGKAGADGRDGEDGKDGEDGQDGKDGFSPIVAVSQVQNGHTVSITDVNGKKSFTVLNGNDGKNGTDGKDGRDGKDGYTPVKGVDYFDGKDGKDGVDGVNGKDGKNGKDGYTPIKGVDYFDGEPGKDGYTPIKGIDYFDGSDGADGQNGQDGKDGEDGKTPYIQNKYWYIDGVNTNVKAEGVDGANGKDGNDGEDGYTPVKGVDYFDGKDGVDGKDYVLTEADKQEIAAMVEVPSPEQPSGEQIPSYWKEHLSEKIQEIKALQRQGGKDCFSFAFITDIHYPTNLGKKSPLLAKKIIDDCNIKFVLCGGDTQTRGCLETKEAILDENEQINEMFSPIKDRLLRVTGNHEGAYGWSGGTANSGTPYVKQLNENEMFEEYIRANGLNGDVHFDKNSLAFYIDDVSNKVRYIGLDSMNVPNKPTDVDNNGFALYPKIYVTQFLQAQYDFLCNDALVTVPSDDWCVVVFGHSGIYQSKDYGVMVDLLSAYKNKTLCVSDYAGTPSDVANFTNLFDVNGDGFAPNSKLKNDNGASVEVESSSCFTSNKIPVYFNKTTPCVLRISGVPDDDEHNLALSLVVYNASGNTLCSTINIPATSDFVKSDDGVYTWNVGQLGNYMSTTQFGTTSYLRVTSKNDTLNTLVITVDEEIEYSEVTSYDAVSVNADFTNAKGQFIAYFHGHNHKDEDYVRYSKDASRTMVDIGTRCDGHQENVDGKDETVEDDALYNERVEGTITEQSFDVFTVNKVDGKIYATKIGAGDDRVIDY